MKFIHEHCFESRRFIKEINTDTSCPPYTPHTLVSGLLWLEYRALYIMLLQGQVNSGLFMGGKPMDVRMKNKKCETRQPVTRWPVIATAPLFSSFVALMWDFSTRVVMSEPVVSSMWMEGKEICLPLFFVSCFLEVIFRVGLTLLCLEWCHLSLWWSVHVQYNASEYFSSVVG